MIKKEYVTIVLASFVDAEVQSHLDVQADHGFRLHSVVADTNPDPNEWGGYALIFERDREPTRCAPGQTHHFQPGQPSCQCGLFRMTAEPSP